MSDKAHAIYDEFGYDELLNQALCCAGEHVHLGYVAHLKRALVAKNKELKEALHTVARFCTFVDKTPDNPCCCACQCYEICYRDVPRCMMCGNEFGKEAERAIAKCREIVEQQLKLREDGNGEGIWACESILAGIDALRTGPDDHTHGSFVPPASEIPLPPPKEKPWPDCPKCGRPVHPNIPCEEARELRRT